MKQRPLFNEEEPPRTVHAQHAEKLAPIFRCTLAPSLQATVALLTAIEIKEAFEAAEALEANHTAR